MTGHGPRAEDVVEELCRRMFLAHFTIRGQQFTKADGASKEAADVLVPFGEDLLAFQVKSKRAAPAATADFDLYLRRVEKAVTKGIDQLKIIKRALAAGHLRSLTNSLGITIPFDPRAISRVVGIVVLDLPDDTGPHEERIHILNGYVHRHGMPVHIFRSDDLGVISSEIDTMPDFLHYLRAREAIFSKGLALPLPRELDLLAFYKMQHDLVEQAISGSVIGLSLDHGIWEAYRSNNETQIRQRDIDNNPSYLVDRAVEWLHTSVGFTLPLQPVAYTPPQVPPPHTSDQVASYSRVAFEFSRTSRTFRRVIGRKWLEKVSLAETRGLAYSVIMTREHEAVLVAASGVASRQERTKQLEMLSLAAYCWLGLARIVAIVTEPASATLRSYDAVLWEDVQLDSAAVDELRHAGEALFGPYVPFHEHEFRARSDEPG